MSADKQRPARYRLTFAVDVPADLIAVQMVDTAALDAAQAIIDDLPTDGCGASYSVSRTSSGDLTGLARVKFDIPSRRPQRFRLIYRQVDEGTRHVLAIGLRDEHAIYRRAVQRGAQA